MTYFEWLDLITEFLLQLGFPEENIDSIQFSDYWDNHMEWYEVVEEVHSQYV
jgi:hypothetical protein